MLAFLKWPVAEIVQKYGQEPIAPNTELTKRGNRCIEKVKKDTPSFIPVFY